MNAVEIESAVSDLAAQPFNGAEFPFQFLAAFDKKETTLKRLRKGDSNKSDVPGGVLLQANIHLAVCPPGETRATLERLKASPKTSAGKAKFVLATDGLVLEAEDLLSGEAIAPDYPRFAEHIGFFLPLAGISTVREIKDNPIDVRATGRLNKLYVELLTQNPEWATEARRHDMNHFMARLIFCFFAEDTDIFPGGRGLFTSTIELFTESDGSNTHEVLEVLFQNMNTDPNRRDLERLPGWAVPFPYVNGGLFSDSAETPHFTRIARSFLLQAGSLDWQHINPDIFGSMIQAVADEAERGALGMHYTSVPNILKVLNPLFLDDVRAQLAAAGTNVRALRKLRERLRRIRVFDPACGSGNFLVIAYKHLRHIEADIDRALGETPAHSVLSLKNFRGIEIRDFAVEIARLALVIAEYQSNVLYLGEQQARLVFLPLASENWIRCDNALRVDWLVVCPPEGHAVVRRSNDLFQDELEQTGIDFENEGGETYICGNPPYLGSQDQSAEQKCDLLNAWGSGVALAGSMDYVSGWFMKAREYVSKHEGAAAFVTTNSLNQGRQVSACWPYILGSDVEIPFAVPSFKWSNLATGKAVVTVSIVCLARRSSRTKHIIVGDTDISVSFIGPYLVPNQSVIVSPRRDPLSGLSAMQNGSMPNDGGGLILTTAEAWRLRGATPNVEHYLRRFVGSEDCIHGDFRYCLWIDDARLDAARAIPGLRKRIDDVEAARRNSRRRTTRELARVAHRFGEIRHLEQRSMLIPRHSSEDRPYLPFDLVDATTVVGDSAFFLPEYSPHEIAIFASRLHLVWIATVCGKLETRFRYSNTLGWNTFPVPPLTEQNKADLTQCAEDILLAREAHFPATIAALYDPENMPANLRAAHEANDETLERIYIGRRFRNDTERLEKLFEMYAKMTAGGTGSTPRRSPSGMTTRKTKAKTLEVAEVQA